MKYFQLTLLIMLSLQLRAQLPDYYVYLVSGNVTISGQGKKTASVKQNQLIYKTDTIILKKESEVTLVDRDANFLVLNKAGVYKGTDLVKIVKKKNNDGVTTKYLKLLFQELLDPNENYEKFKEENIVGAWGGVSRGEGCSNRIFPFNGLKTSGSSVDFTWHQTSPSLDYLLFIYDADGNELARIVIKDTVRAVNIKETLQGKPGKYFWKVTSKDGTCEDEIPIYFEILTVESEKKLTDQLLAGTGTESLEKQLHQIDILEKNALIQAASSRYAALVKANPGNEALRKSYISFLLKYGFNKEAATVWK